MKVFAVLLSCLLTLGLCSCQQRSAPVAAMETTSPEQEINLDPLIKSSAGQALLGCVKEVISVTVSDKASGEVVYESSDDVLSQSMYDALNIVSEPIEVMQAVVADYDIHFSTKLGFEKNYEIWLELSAEGPVIVQSEGFIWSLPETESDWIRSRLKGLA